jgi:hypothetical protein
MKSANMSKRDLNFFKKINGFEEQGEAGKRRQQKQQGGHDKYVF